MGVERRAASRESYDPEFFETLFKAEDRHFWFRARNQVIAALVRRATARFPAGYRVLEVGCGTGNVLQMLHTECAGGSVTGMDLFEEGLRFARRRTSCPLVVGDVHRPAFACRFDLVCLFDVLEHLPDDAQTLRDLSHLLLPGRLLLLTVPAHMSLWSYFDVASCHCRRYELVELQELLARTGYDVEYISEFMTALFPLVWAVRRLRKTGSTAEGNRQLATAEMKVVPVVNQVMASLLSLEPGWIAKQRRLPLGTSLIVLASKRA